MFERYSEKARRAIFFARYEASQFGRSFIESEHLLLGLVREDKSLLTMLRIPDAEKLRKRIEERMPATGERVSTSLDLPLSDECKRALTYAAEDAELLGHKHIETWHLALGLLRHEKSAVAELLRENGMDRATLLELVRAKPVDPPVRSPRWERPEPESGIESEPELPETVAPSLQLPLTRLQILLTGSKPHLKAFSNADGAARLKRKDWSRRQAMGHLIDWATTHSHWVARALTEPKVVASGYPLDEWVTAQHYESLRFLDLVVLWLRLNHLLLHVLARVPEAKLDTPFRAGIEEPTTLLHVIERYVEHCEDMVAQVLVRS